MGLAGDIRGQDEARAGLERAAAEGDHVLMIGPPGCGATLLARRFRGLFPPMSNAERAEVREVWTANGWAAPDERPFRAPHHTISLPGMCGDTKRPMCELTLARHGVLFLDLVSDFSPAVLEELGHALPHAQVRLIAYAHPCPCGWHGVDPGPPNYKCCLCTERIIARHLDRLTVLMRRVEMRMIILP